MPGTAFTTGPLSSPRYPIEKTALLSTKSAAGSSRLMRSSGPAGAAAGWLLAQEPLPGCDELAGFGRPP